MKPHRLAAVLFAALSAGCTYSSLDYGSDPDASAEQVARVNEDQMGGAYPHEDLRMGTGRAAQWNRKMTFDLELAAPDGRSYGAGRVTVLYPRPTGPGFDSGTYRTGFLPDEIWGGIAGMREGGRRRFRVGNPNCRNTTKKQCEIVDADLGRRLVYPTLAPLDVTVSVERVCRPQLVLKKVHQIIDVHTDLFVKELWCR
jgi:hypothetical protein